MSNRAIILLCIAATAAGAAGCGDGPEAQFVLNQTSTEQLAPEARNEVRRSLEEGFGTPNHLVAWLRMPVEFGGVEGKVVEAGIDGNPSRFKVEMSGDVGTLESGPELYWLTGTYNDKTLNVASYDDLTQEVTLQETLEVPPGLGDTFLLNAGATLKEGRRLYMTHCMHCHGVTGDGAGPTAQYLNPLPRDYRLGIFKFTSTVKRGLPGDKVRRDDLARTIRDGIPGTYMPSFLLMEEHELAAIIEYVRWLSMRGELEVKLDADLTVNYSPDAVKDRLSEDEPPTRQEIFAGLKEEVANSVESWSESIAKSWVEAESEESVVRPTKHRTPVAQDPDSIARGRALYLSAKAKCVTCHGVTGRGDGANTETVQAGKDVPGLYDDWGHKIRPRDLTTGIFRGGRRPVDIYRRIRAGIKGTPMPPFDDNVLSDDDVWDLVNYVLYIPHEDNGTYVAPAAEVATQSRAVN